MAFQNNTKENIKYRTGTLIKGFEWHTVRPGEECDVPVELAAALSLTKVEYDKQEAVEDKKDVKQGLRKEKTAKDTKKSKKKLFSKRIVAENTTKKV